jgi:flagellar basal body rod protein FlgG
MSYLPPVATSAAQGLRNAQRRLEVAAHDVANIDTDDFQPLLEDGTPGDPGSLDLVGEMVAAMTAPIAYAANAKVLHADGEMRGMLVDLLG